MKVLLENWKKFTEAEDTTTTSAPVIQFPDWLKGKLQDVHGKPGQGSVFAISIDEVVKKVQEVLANTKDIEKIANSTGTVSVNVPGIGYDLVIPKEQAMKLPDAKLGTVEKQEGPSKIAVPSVTTSAPISNFKSDQLTIIVRPMKDDAGNPKPNQFIILSAFPGNPSIPRASEWGDKFAVVIPQVVSELEENNQPKVELFLNKMAAGLGEGSGFVQQLKDILNNSGKAWQNMSEQQVFDLLKNTGELDGLYWSIDASQEGDPPPWEDDSTAYVQELVKQIQQSTNVQKDKEAAVQGFSGTFKESKLKQIISEELEKVLIKLI